MDVGAATARVLRDSDWRVALIASSSWSHAFLCDKTWRLYPDMDSDRHLFKALERADYDAWQDVSLEALEDAGQQELLSWFALIGAMKELGRVPTWTTMVESYIFNSNKAFALFE
jgi:predicted class III extradiol MEMO1 family dioxygenase